MGHKVMANDNDQSKLSRDTHNVDLYLLAFRFLLNVPRPDIDISEPVVFIHNLLLLNPLVRFRT